MASTIKSGRSLVPASVCPVAMPAIHAIPPVLMTAGRPLGPAEGTTGRPALVSGGTIAGAGTAITGLSVVVV